MKKKISLKLKDIYDIVMEKHVFGSSAEMSYYLMLSVFPAIILIYGLIGMLDINWISLSDIFDGVLPEGVLKPVANYLTYVERNISKPMTFAAFAIILTSASALIRSVLNIMADIQGKGRFHGLFGVAISIVIAVAFIVVIYLSIIVIMTGEGFLHFLDDHFHINYIWMWKWLRFIVLFLLMFAVIYALYILTQPKNKRRVYRAPGALIATALLVAVSMVFSHLITTSTRYTLIYGSLASVIIMLVWLYFCSLIIIFGNIINYELALPKLSRRQRRKYRRVKKAVREERKLAKKRPNTEENEHNEANSEYE